MSGLSFGSFGGELYKNFSTCSNGLANFKPECKSDQSENVKNGNLKENGDIGNSLHCSSLSSGNEEITRKEGIDLSSSVLENEGGSLEKLTLQDHDVVSLKEGFVNGTSHGGLQKQCQKASDGPAKTVEDLRPRGLINSGNLCFLNATLQALLSCSPLIKLLLELRNRNISKVCFLCFLILLLFL